EHITTGIYGDIFLADLRRYRENDLAEIGLKTAFPLWGENTKALVQEFLAAGFKARLVCVSDQQLGESFAGQPLTEALIRTFPAGVDPGGENGEYHSFVYAGPIFSQPVPYETGEIILRDYAPATQPDSDGLSNQPVAYDTRFWFCDLVPVTE
ncbi:MAG: ATP-binding protein, partial [Adhaeribacter sp.]|nr:ATP-binding protein [Adhaeribacter sp.]